jgi:hypothetical protein
MRNDTEQQSVFAGWSFGLILFCAALSLGPIQQLDFFRLMPGDNVDARLNLVFLENIYAYLSGQASSLIHLSFFYPYPYVSAFSDNLFGAAPIYLFARLCSLTPEAAFQFWFILGYFLNYIAACYCFRLFGQSRSASAIGAVLFTFGLPVSAQMGHAQLQYRFGLALAITYFYLFLIKSDWRDFLVACFWLVWQFYCSIYLGFFASLFMATLLMFHLLRELYQSVFLGLGFHASPLSKFVMQFRAQSAAQKLLLFIGLAFVLLLLVSLFLPYLEVTKLYRFARTWMEVSAMSPRIFSYFLADHSFIWGSLSEKLQGVPIRWEQQLFIGFVPLSFLVFGAIQSRLRIGWSSGLSLVIVSFLFLLILTLNFNDHSLWRFLIGLPLFSAIRALSRIILLFLFPVSLFLAAAIDLILKNNPINKNYFLVFISLPFLLEVSGVQATTSLKGGWRARADLEAVRLPSALPRDPILFLAQRELSFESEELDAMIVAQKKHLPTLNGYSGALPHHFRAQYGDDCAEYPRRILLYLEFTGQNEKSAAYRELAQRVAPIGFVGCEEAWRKEAPMSFARQALSHEIISQLSLELASQPLRRSEGSQGNPTHLALKIINKSKDKISALTLIDQPLRLAWRLQAKTGAPQTSWTQPRQDQPAGLLPQGYRRDLPGDIPPDSAIEILAPIPSEVFNSDKMLEFTLVQEATIWGFSLPGAETLWAQDVGLTPLKVDISRL